jgi:hypothetical protein
MPEDQKPTVPQAMKDSIGYSFMRASHGDPWDCIRYTGTLITDLTIVADIISDKDLRAKCGASSRMWEEAVRVFESSKDDAGNPNWGRPVLICTRILKLLGKDSTQKYGKIPSDSGQFVGPSSRKE